MTQKSILIAGSGAVATLFAARLGSAGYPVKMLGHWMEGIRAINANGAQSVDGSGKKTAARAEVFDRPEDAGQADYVIVLVKSWQTRQYAGLLKTCISQNGIVLSLQNGVGNREILAEELGEERCLAGTVVVGAALLEPGIVQVSGYPKIQLQHDLRIEPLAEILNLSGFEVDLHDDLNSLIWGKLVINSGINPLSALLGATNGELAECEHCRPLLAALAREGEQTANACGIQLPYKDALTAILEVAQWTGENTSSMLQDLRRGAPTEIDAINGEIIRYAHQAGVRVPVNEIFVELIKSRVELLPQ